MEPFMKTTTWEDHFQALREAVTETMSGEPGFPVAVHLLAQLRDLVRLFPFLMEVDETRQDFLSPQVGEVFSFYLRRSVPWDWEAMRPVLERNPTTPSMSGTDEDGNEWDSRGPKPCSGLEAVSLSAVSKGLGWLLKEGGRTPVLFRGLEGLSGFPQENPSPIPEGLPHRWDLVAMETAEGILKGLGRDKEAVFNSVMTHGPILPWTVTIGGETPLTPPAYGFPFDKDLVKLLGVESEVWTGLRLQKDGWEVSFSVFCRGLEVNETTREASFILEVRPHWRSGDPLAMLEWGPGEWLSWSGAVAKTLEETMDRLGRRHDQATGTGGAVGGGSATVTLSGESTGLVEVVPTLTVTPSYAVSEVEMILRPASWVSGEGRVSTLAQGQLRLFGKPAPDYTKAKNLHKILEERLAEGVGLQEEGEQPSWLVWNKARKEGRWDLTKEEVARIRTTLLEDKSGFIEEGDGGLPQLVIGYKLEKPGGGVEQRERRLSGHGLAFLNRRNRNALRDRLLKEEAALEKEAAKLRVEVETALIKPTEDLDHSRRVLGRNKKNQGFLTSWDMAMDLLKHLMDEQAISGRNPIEVEALAIRDWLWAGREAPDNWLQTVGETLLLLAMHLNTGDAGPKGQAIGGSFIDLSYRHKEDRTKGLSSDEAKGVRGSSLVYIIRIQETLLGGFVHLKTGTRTLPSGVEAETFETGSLTKTQKKAAYERGERFGFREAHLSVILRGLGCDEAEAALGEHLHSYMTKAGSQSAGQWAEKVPGGKYPDGDIFRHYTSNFQGCHLLPAPGEGFLHGALASLKTNPELGWDMGGPPKASRHKGGLLHFMGLELPVGGSGAMAERARAAVLLRGLKALRRIVVELGGGVLAARLGGYWHNLGDPNLSEPVAVHLLQKGKVFPFLSPGWIDRAKAAYEPKAGVKLTRSIKEADERRWETRTVETTPEGIPLHVQLQTAIKDRGLSQLQVAGEFGVSQKTVSVWLKGDKPLSRESAKKIREWVAQG